jgi:hypothetical protein
MLATTVSTGAALGQGSVSAPTTDPDTVLATYPATDRATAPAQKIRGESC